MAKILFAWEYGAGLGHVGVQVPVARLLREHGHQILFAVRNLGEPWPLLDSHGFAAIQAPYWPINSRLLGENGRTRSFADVLAIHGFDDVATLLPMLNAWDAILAAEKPDLIVADYAPGAGVAAYGRIPIVLTGSGYCLPPVDRPEFPALHLDGKELIPQARILENVQTVQRRRGQREIAELPQVMAGVGRFMPSFAEFDPYGHHRTDVAVGSFEAIAPLPIPESPFFAAFLPAEHPHLETLVRSLGEARMPGIVYVRGADAGVYALLEAAGLEYVRTPLALPPLLPNVTVVLHHAGLGFTTNILAAGRPQVLCPMIREQTANAQNVVRLGCGIRIGHQIPCREAGRALNRVMSEPRFAFAAQAWAAKFHARHPEGGLAVVVQACEQALHV